jgi:hypothetical protein
VKNSMITYVISPVPRTSTEINHPAYPSSSRRPPNTQWPCVGLDEEDLAAAMPCLYPSSYEHPVVFVVDSITVASPEHPVLVIGLDETDDDPPFRSLPGDLCHRNNLSLSNMDFYDYTSAAAQQGGVFRGFRR